MQVTVARAIRSLTAGFTCCFYQGESQVFTPRPNSITTIPMRLPVTAFVDFDAGVEVVDYLALTVLGNNIAIPGRSPATTVSRVRWASSPASTRRTRRTDATTATGTA